MLQHPFVSQLIMDDKAREGAMAALLRCLLNNETNRCSLPHVPRMCLIREHRECERRSQELKRKSVNAATTAETESVEGISNPKDGRRMSKAGVLRIFETFVLSRLFEILRLLGLCEMLGLGLSSRY
jgi:hypothetical protein